MSNLVTLPGVVAAPTGEPDAGVVALCEELLDRARRGEIAALAYAVVEGGGWMGSAWDYGSAAVPALCHAVDRLHFRMLRRLTDAPAVPHEPGGAS